MTITDDGTFDPDRKAVILDAMMADAREKFGADLNDDDMAVIRLFYEPVAERFAQSQLDISEVLKSAQIAFAEGKNLDLLAEQIGVAREPAQKATGSARFSRGTAASVDYTVPKGTVVQTDSLDPIEFKTTKSVTLLAGTTSVDANIEAVEGGVRSNVGANTIIVMKDAPTGIESVTNPAETSGGSDREVDRELRARALKEVGAGSRASAPSIIRGLRRVDGVKSVSIFVNDENTADADNRPAHSFEAVVEGGNAQDVADQILELKAAGDTSVGGYAGTLVSKTSALPNGQTMTIDFSTPASVQIYADMSMDVTDEYAGDDAVRDSIVSYIGGLLASGNETGGELGVGKDVLIGEVEYAIREVAGVYDVTGLTIDTVSPPAGTTNLAIANSERATSDATDGSMTITTTVV